MSGLSANELTILNIITKVSAPIGFLGVVGMVFMYLRSPQSFANPTGRIVLAISVADLLDCIVKFIGRWGPEAGIHSTLCKFQAAGIQESNFSSVLLGMFMGLNALYITYFRGSMEEIRKYESVIIVGCFIAPLPFAIVPLFVEPVPGVPMYGDANQWCWFTRTYSLYQLYLWFIILWIIFLFNLIAFVLTRYALNSSASALFGAAMTAKQSPGIVRYRMFIIKRMMAYMIAFLVVWTPSTFNRIVQLSLGYPVFWPSVIQSIISPSRGLFNFLAYFYTWWSQPSFAQKSFVMSTSDSALSKDDRKQTQRKVKSSRAVELSDEDLRSAADIVGKSSKSFVTADSSASLLSKDKRRDVVFSDATLDRVKLSGEIVTDLQNPGATARTEPIPEVSEKDEEAEARVEQESHGMKKSTSKEPVVGTVKKTGADASARISAIISGNEPSQSRLSALFTGGRSRESSAKRSTSIDRNRTSSNSKK